MQTEPTPALETASYRRTNTTQAAGDDANAIVASTPLVRPMVLQATGWAVAAALGIVLLAGLCEWRAQQAEAVNARTPLEAGTLAVDWRENRLYVGIDSTARSTLVQSHWRHLRDVVYVGGFWTIALTLSGWLMVNWEPQRKPVARHSSVGDLTDAHPITAFDDIDVPSIDEVLADCTPALNDPPRLRRHGTRQPVTA